MTKKVAFFVDNGFEEMELVAPLDVLRRGGLEVDLIAAHDEDFIKGSHNIVLVPDKKISEVSNILDYDAIVVPGGMPGAANLRDNKKVIKFYNTMHENKKLVAAICAAPIVLNQAGITKDKKVTCYPSFETQIEFKEHDSRAAVVIDNNVITGQGPAVAILFGLAILEYLAGDEVRNQVADAMLLPVLKENL